MFAMLECIVVGWCYGTERLQEDITSMWGQRLKRFMAIGIKFVCPLLLFVVFCYSLYSYRPPKYGDYIYPTWATVVGWLISLASLLPLPVVFIWTIVNRHETTLKQKLKKSLEPNEDWGLTARQECSSGVLQPMVDGELTPV
ncbi:sodium- and chloride-dependent glycine transporter 1-like [Haliotis rubra]|uniref:sodium- and chloride-dependent glycine transporter 1-like n=1 Tax=Haliotis rubra TaxID=36100 RepID=UPI001EE5FA52|nr:sodium- and chloride-dependent glycine transporter 1-like [Haliotis rubra]